MSRLKSMLMMSVLFSIGMVLSEANSAWAKKDDTITLSIEEAVMQTLQHNETLLLRQMQPVRAGAFEQLERGTYDPALFFEGRYGQSSATEVSRSTGQQFDVKARETAVVAGIEQQTPTGTHIAASVSSAWSDSSRTREQYATRVGLSVTQQLLQGRSLSVNLARVHRAGMETKISRHELAAYTEALVAETEEAYWQYVSAVESVTVVLKSLEVSRAELEDVKERIAVGSLPANDAASAAAEVGLREQKLLTAEQVVTERRIDLQQLMTPSLDMAFDVTIVPRFNFGDPEIMDSDNVETHVHLAMKSRQELKEAALKQQQGELDVTMTRNGVLPRLELFIDLGKSGYSGSFGESVSAMNGPSHDIAAGIRFRHVLGNRSARAKREIAAVDLSMQQSAIRNLKKMIAFDVYGAWRALETARELVTLTEETYVHRETALTSIQDRLESGAATRLEVVQAERDLLESALEAVNARVNFQIAQVRFYRAEGTLLTRRGISVDTE